MSKNKKRVSNILNMIISVIFLVIVVFIIKDDVKKTFNETFNNTTLETLSLTTEQKIEDFESMYETIILGFPNLDDVKETYSIDFKDRKQEYVDIIKNTKNDFEFYCVMTAITQELASYHTDMCFPDYGDIRTMKGYGYKSVLAEKNLISYTNYWNGLIEDYCDKYSNAKVAEFKYVDGKYVFDLMWSSEDYSELKGWYLTKIDDIGIDHYILNNISIYATQFDTNYNKPYKRVITLNDSIGTKHNVTLVNESGKSKTMEIYTSIEMEIVSVS